MTPHVDSPLLTELRSFIAVLDHGSVVGASRAIGYSTAAVSRHVSRIEARYCTTLFERRNRSLVPTEAAPALGEAARHLMAACDHFLVRTREVRGSARSPGEPVPHVRDPAA